MTAAPCQRCGTPLSGRSRKWCSENCRKRACDERNRAVCTDCGVSLGTRSGWSHPEKRYERCVECRRQADAERHAQRIQHVADMYNAGLSYRAMSDALGYGRATSVSVDVNAARRLGLVGYRYTAYQEAA